MVRKPAIRAEKAELTTSDNVSNESNAMSPVCRVPVTQFRGTHETGSNILGNNS